MPQSLILVPTYNERENIALLIPEIFAAHPQVRVMVIDDNSPDKTADEVRALMAKYPNLSLLLREKKAGLGAAYQHAFQHAMTLKGVERIITMDADGSHGVEYLAPMLEASTTHQVVIGSRYIKGGSAGEWVWWRRLLSKWGNRYARALSGLPLFDMTAGFICLDMRLLRRMDLAKVGTSGYAFLIDLKFHAIHDCAASVKEIPIILKPRREGESKISTHIIREGFVTPLRLFARRFW